MSIFSPFAPVAGVVFGAPIFLLALCVIQGGMIWWELREMRKRAGLIPLKKPVIKRRVL